MRNSRNTLLDLCRGLAALEVCAGHLRAALFVDYPANSSFAAKAFYALTGFGHQSVMVFFVLSGYFVGGAVLRTTGRSFSIGPYTIARLSRLWTVLLPALLFTFVVDHITGSLQPHVLAGGLQATWNSGPVPGTFGTDIVTFIGNALFLQTIAVPVYGTNSPLWSLANEAVYYVAFPMLALASGRVQATIATRTLAGASVLVAMVALPSGFASGFALFTLGALTSLAHQNHFIESLPANRLLTLIVTLAFLVGLAASKLHAAAPFGDIIVGGAFALLLLFMTPNKSAGILARPAVFLSEISFSLYVFHFPLLVMLASITFGEQQLTFGPVEVAIYCTWLLFMVLAAAGLWFVFERRTNEVRQFAARIFLSKGRRTYPVPPRK